MFLSPLITSPKVIMFYSIKAKMITLFSLVMICFTALLLVTIFINQRENVLNLELKKSSEISNMHANILSQEFAQYIAMLKMQSDDSQLKKNDPDKIKKILQRLMKVGNRNFVNAIYVDQNLNLVDASGNKNKVTNPLFLKGEEWKNKPYNITVPVNTFFEKKPVIIVAVPVLNDQDKWQGTLAVAVPLKTIIDKLSSIKLANGSYAWLADSNDLVVAHPAPSVVMNARLSTDDSVDFPGFYKITRQTKLQNNGYGRYYDTQLQESKIVTFSKIQNLPGWNLFVTTQEVEIFRGIYSIVYSALTISIILMIVFLFIISQLSNKVTGPIVRLTKDVKASVTAKSNFIRIIHSKDEIGALSKAFHRSLQKIHHHTTQLEEMVRERTKEISSKNSLLNEQNDKLEVQVSKDSLTNLYNRRAFNALVEKELSRAKRHHVSIALAVLDLDNFKNINDKYGHDTGDKVLCRFANELTTSMRKEDLICRWGGEEFVVLLSASTSEKVYEHMEEVRERVATMDFSPAPQVTFSAGMSTYREGESFTEWFKRADKALYKAKDNGRNQIVKV